MENSKDNYNNSKSQLNITQRLWNVTKAISNYKFQKTGSLTYKGTKSKVFSFEDIAPPIQQELIKNRILFSVSLLQCSYDQIEIEKVKYPEGTLSKTKEYMGNYTFQFKFINADDKADYVEETWTQNAIGVDNKAISIARTFAIRLYLMSSFFITDIEPEIEEQTNDYNKKYKEKPKKVISEDELNDLINKINSSSNFKELAQVLEVANPEIKEHETVIKARENKKQYLAKIRENYNLIKTLENIEQLKEKHDIIKKDEDLLNNKALSKLINEKYKELDKKITSEDSNNKEQIENSEVEVENIPTL